MTAKLSAVAKERQRILQIVDNVIESAVDDWQLFICRHGEDAEIAVWTLVAELDGIREQIHEREQKPGDK